MPWLVLLFGGCGEVGPFPPLCNGEGASPDVPLVQLSVSNTTPQVNEEVVLRCEAMCGAEGAVYSFEPLLSRLVVNAQTGVATIIVTQSDVGVAISFTCRATNAAGTGPASNSQLVIASGP